MKQNPNSRAFAVSSPFQASTADYMYLVIPNANGMISVSVNYLLVNHVTYRNTYNSNTFESKNDFVRSLASDFETEVLPLLKMCL